MADFQQPAAAAAAAPVDLPSPVPRGTTRQNHYQTYKQPLPFKIFPFPSLTSNPISFLHLAFSWLSQLLIPPPAEPSIVHTAYWDHGTKSITVSDERSMVDLWQQGFFGKGSLSRSEPNWLKREKTRLGLVKEHVSEVETDRRRAERNRAKWDRARAEQEALERRRSEEAASDAHIEHEDALVIAEALPETISKASAHPTAAAPVGPLELLSLPNSQLDLQALQHLPDGSSTSENAEADSSATGPETTPLKHAKMVRFSPTVEATEFLHNDPPSPLKPGEADGSRSTTETSSHTSHTSHTSASRPATARCASRGAGAEPSVVNKEHLQLLPEEALFLTFVLGALRVLDSATQEAMSPEALLSLLRKNSYFPPRLSPQELRPDDPFLIHYAVYHHFRSLGWVPRAGIKFGVDWLLYTRGPVFDHAEYGLLVLPSYSDAHWESVGKRAPRRSWHWLMGVNRVLSKVFKTVLLVYVDVPPPAAFGADGSPSRGLAGLLGQYTIREQVVKRWSSNRNRD